MEYQEFLALNSGYSKIKSGSTDIVSGSDESVEFTINPRAHAQRGLVCVCVCVRACVRACVSVCSSAVFL